VAHNCNPNYSGSRDQEDYGSKPAKGNSLSTLSRKSPTQNRGCGVAQVVEYQPSRCEALIQITVPQKRKKRKKKPSNPVDVHLSVA
jgi:hypothetical protein